MSSHHQHIHAPFASARGYLIPVLSFALSLPTLVVSALTTYHALTGYTFDVSTQVVQVSPLVFGFGSLYIIFGPVLGSIICITQRTRAEQIYGSVHLLGFRIKRMNTIALYIAALALGLLLFSVMLTILGTALTSSGPD